MYIAPVEIETAVWYWPVAEIETATQSLEVPATATHVAP